MDKASRSGNSDTRFQLFRDYPLGKVCVVSLALFSILGFQLFRDYPLGKDHPRYCHASDYGCRVVSNYSEIIPSVRYALLPSGEIISDKVSNYSEIIPSVRRLLLDALVFSMKCSGFQLFRDYPLGKAMNFRRPVERDRNFEFPTIPRLSPR